MRFSFISEAWPLIKYFFCLHPVSFGIPEPWKWILIFYLQAFSTLIYLVFVREGSPFLKRHTIWGIHYCMVKSEVVRIHWLRGDWSRWVKHNIMIVQSDRQRLIGVKKCYRFNDPIDGGGALKLADHERPRTKLAPLTTNRESAPLTHRQASSEPVNRGKPSRPWCQFFVEGSIYLAKSS